MLHEPCCHFACTNLIALDPATPASTIVTCSAGHDNRVADCPIGGCPSRKVLVSAGAHVGRVVHHKACQHDVIVTSMDPTLVDAY